MLVRMTDLSGRVAMVVGAEFVSGGAIALALAEAGCQVGINDLEEDDDARETIRRIEAMGRKAAFYAADISDDGQVQAMMADFVADFGTIDVLANNPYWSKNRPFLELEADNWSRTMDVCVKGFFLCSQAAYLCPDTATAPRDDQTTASCRSLRVNHKHPGVTAADRKALPTFRL